MWTFGEKKISLKKIYFHVPAGILQLNEECSQFQLDFIRSLSWILSMAHSALALCAGALFKNGAKIFIIYWPVAKLLKHFGALEVFMRLISP